MSLNRMLGGVLLIAGTSIGAGMLALPSETASLGFPNSILLFGLSWAFMGLSALLFLECALVSRPHSNLLRMAEEFLGPFGKIIALLSYLALMYALCAAYLSGLSDWLLEGSSSLFALELSRASASSLATMLIGACLLYGVWLLDHLNRLFMFGLILSFIILIWIISPSVHLDPLLAHTGSLDLSKLPLIVTAFGFHIVIPTLVRYIGPDQAKLRKVILLGSAFPLIFYLLWQGLIISALPLDSFQGHPTADLSLSLYKLSGSHFIATAMRGFAFFALITSFLGVSLSLFDCLQDTFRFDARASHRILVVLLTLIPPWLFACFFPNAFVHALYIAGIFVALLLGLLPISMVYMARYKLNKSTWTNLAGQKPVLLIGFIFFLSVIILELIRLS